MKSSHLKLVERTVLRPVAATRKPNAAYRVREHLTEAEMDKLLAALKRNRHGHRDWLTGLLIYRHGLRVSEACDLRWDDIDLAKRTIIIRRLKGSNDSTHYLERDELTGLKALQRSYAKRGINSAWVFVNERGQPFGRMGIARMIERAGEAAKLPFPVHVRCGIRPGTPWPTEGWTLADCSISWVTLALRTRYAIPRCRLSRSKTSGARRPAIVHKPPLVRVCNYPPPTRSRPWPNDACCNDSTNLNGAICDLASILG